MIRPLATCALFACLSAAEDPGSWRVVPAGTTITFHGSSTLHDFDGTAVVSGGAISLVPGAESGWVEVDAKSMQTGNESRDEKMHDEHMTVAAHPAIRFELTALQRSSAGVVARGTWTMHGVSRTLEIPVTLPTAGAAEPRLTARFPIDMRQWSIPVPSAALVVRVDPVVQVAVDLRLEPARDAAPAPAAARTLGELTLSDQRGAATRLDLVARDRLVMYFRLGERAHAKRCDELLSSRLPSGRGLLRVIDGHEIAESDRATLIRRLSDAAGETGPSFLLDWEGRLAKDLRLPDQPLLFLGFDAQGVLRGEVEGVRTGEALNRAFALLGTAADPAFTDAQVNPPARSAKEMAR